MKDLKGMCAKCPKYETCDTLCDACEKYVSQDYVPIMEGLVDINIENRSVMTGWGSIDLDNPTTLKKAIVGMYKDGKNINEISKYVNCSTQYINKIIREYCNRTNKNRHLKDDIIELFKKGYQNAAICGFLNCSKSYVSEVIKNYRIEKILCDDKYNKIYKEIEKIDNKGVKSTTIRYVIKSMCEVMTIREVQKYLPYSRSSISRFKNGNNFKNRDKYIYKTINCLHRIKERYKKAYYNTCKAYYNTYADKLLSYCEEVRKEPKNNKNLQVKCTYCGKWFTPTSQQVFQRIAAIEGKYSLGTENKFYCSEQCKKDCPCYNRVIYRKGENPLIDYRKTVDILTDINYDEYKDDINPNNLERGKRKYHIDHIYSVIDGFNNNIPEEVIANPANLRMLWYSDNINKKGKSEITKEELYKNFNNFCKNKSSLLKLK